MYDIRLVNLPFANLHIPSLGLTQLATVVRDGYPDTVRVRIDYLNHDFADFLGIELYRDICALGEHQNSGVGDWFFRQVAFPDAPDNTEAFLQRYYPGNQPEFAEFKAELVGKRARLPDFLDSLIERYGLAGADLVGMTSMFAQNVACFALAQRIKLRSPEVVTVIGGANCETPMGERIAAGVSQIDYVFSGPALRSFPALVGRLMADDSAGASRIHGVFCAENLGRILRPSAPGKAHLLTPGGAVLPMGQELDVNTLLELDYDSFLADLAASFPGGDVEPVLPFETSRGCWWGEKAHCTFCGLNSLSMNYRDMSAENAKKLMRSLFERYGHTYKQYICVDNIMPRSYVRDVFADLDPPEGTSIFYEVKADMTDDDLAVLSRAGVNIVQPGIESLATSTLKLMRKGVSSFRNLRFLQGCARHDVYPTWNLLVGFPGEDPEVYRAYLADLPNMVHLPPPTGVYPVRFDRYSPYFNDADQYGLALEPLDFYRYTYPFPDEVLHDLAYYFADHNYEAEYFAGMVESLDRVREIVIAWQARWHGRNQPIAPRLYLTEDHDGPFVFDSRSGHERRRRITTRERDLLLALRDPVRPDRLDENAQQCLPIMRDRGWLFQDGPRVMSLVLPEPPPQPRYVSSPVADFNFDVDVNDLLSGVDPTAGVGEETVDGAPALAPLARASRRRSRAALMSQSVEGTP